MFIHSYMHIMGIFTTRVEIFSKPKYLSTVRLSVQKFTTYQSETSAPIDRSWQDLLCGTELIIRHSISGFRCLQTVSLEGSLTSRWIQTTQIIFDLLQNVKWSCLVYCVAYLQGQSPDYLSCMRYCRCRLLSACVYRSWWQEAMHTIKVCAKTCNG